MGIVYPEKLIRGIKRLGKSLETAHSHCAFASYFFQNQVVKSEPNGDEVQKVENKAENNEKVENEKIADVVSAEMYQQEDWLYAGNKLHFRGAIRTSAVQLAGRESNR